MDNPSYKDDPPARLERVRFPLDYRRTWNVKSQEQNFSRCVYRDFAERTGTTFTGVNQYNSQIRSGEHIALAVGKAAPRLSGLCVIRCFAIQFE